MSAEFRGLDLVQYLLLGDRNDGEVCAQGADRRGGRDAQRQAAAIFADPQAQRVFIALWIIRRQR